MESLAEEDYDQRDEDEDAPVARFPVSPIIFILLTGQQPAWPDPHFKGKRGPRYGSFARQYFFPPVHTDLLTSYPPGLHATAEFTDDCRWDHD